MSQEYVKKMLLKWYAEGKEIDTDVINYGLVISNVDKAERALFDGMLNTAQATGATLRTVWEFVAALQTRPRPAALVNRILEKNDTSKVDLSDYIQDLYGVTVFDIALLKRLNKLTNVSRDLLREGYRPEREVEAYFREHFFERLRSEEFQNAPARAACFFLCPDLDSAATYARRHTTGRPGNHLLCNVVAATTRTAFEADMTIFDKVELEDTFACSAENIRRYWRQERSEAPLVEVLFQGKAVLGSAFV